MLLQGIQRSRLCEDDGLRGRGCRDCKSCAGIQHLTSVDVFVIANIPNQAKSKKLADFKAVLAEDSGVVAQCADLKSR